MEPYLTDTQFRKERKDIVDLHLVGLGSFEWYS